MPSSPSGHEGIFLLQHWLLDTDSFAIPESLSTFQQSIPLEWVQQALELTNKSSIRRRKLPAELVVWLVVAMGLFRDRSIAEVVTRSTTSFIAIATMIFSGNGRFCACP